MKNHVLHASISAARTSVDDLQAENEVSTRCADRMRADAAAIGERVTTHLRYAARLGNLSRCAQELKASLAQQRAILRDLRRSIDSVRAALRE